MGSFLRVVGLVALFICTADGLRLSKYDETKNAPSLLELVTKYAHPLKSGMKESERGYGEDGAQVSEEIAACEKHLRDSGVKNETIAASCISNGGGDTLLANREMYEKHFKQLFQRRTGPIALLQVGVFRGESLAVWADYLPTGSKILGLDVNLLPYEAFKPILKKKGAFGDATADVRVLEADSTSNESMKRTKALHPELQGPWDIIIDDGCHSGGCIMTTLQQFYATLSPGGVYFVEDNLETDKLIRETNADGWASHDLKNCRCPDKENTPGSEHHTYLHAHIKRGV